MGRDHPLSAYHAKRDFAHTPEPAGEKRVAKRRGKAVQPALQFVIQRHHARRLHYDFRLEWGGTLKSWAVPRGPSLDPDIQRLAVEVEDHPLDYAGFEGTIPKGHYGAGDVAIWDRGEWIPEGDAEEGLRRGKLHFELRGTRLHGAWVLFRLAGEGDQWMLRKRRDQHARIGDGDAVLHDPPEAEAPPAPAPAPVAAKSPRSSAASSRRRRVPVPEFVEPQLATLVDRPPVSDAWVYEIKYDGYRMLVRCDGRQVRLFSRNGIEWTERLPSLVQRLSALQSHSGWLDGEIVVMDEHGHTDFHALQATLDSGAPQVEYVVFDVPWWDGEDLRDRPLSHRLQALDEIFAALPAQPGLSRSKPLDPGYVGQAVLQAACQLGLEGLIGKRLDAPYRSGRSPHWIKLKCRSEQEVVIGGYTEPRGSRGHLGALLVGVWGKDGQLDYAGRVGSGFDQAGLQAMRERLAPDETARCPFRSKPSLPGAPTVHWVEPVHVVQVRYASWTQEGLLRQASFVGVREDKPVRKVVRELPQTVAQEDTPMRPSATRLAGRPASPAATAARASLRRSGASSDPKANSVGGVRVTHPERLVFSVPRITKLEVVRYHEDIGEYLLPHLAARPLSLLRCPQGTGGECFFQKHVETTLPSGVESVEVPASDGTDTLVMVNSVEGIVALAQYGNVEFHTWGARAPRPDRPDRITMDLDPDPDLPWAQVVEAAQLTRVLLEELGLAAFLKTTGGKGLHIVTPIKATRSWDEVKAFTKGLASRLASVAPQRFTARLSKSSRGGRIFIDYLRNGRGATAVASYSLRAREGAPVSVPLHWDELSAKKDVRAEHFNLRNAVARAPESETAWQDYAAQRRTLTVKMFRALGVDPGSAES
ncbi:DNA ligase D [Caldimonas brevitalea]|uniref:DNA ligase (ATP) n=1 Tax=Caldimonas brevitalea TaxID=413882 RepID=A0A0G3BR42_9BURK|nr:DNA ligase D [Caldimonas brevitalea]AKJ29816.1 bifunctional non-homologous end joining protein LigD [Caldimonas brevitalea]